MRKGIAALLLAAVAGAGWAASRWAGPRPMTDAAFAAQYAQPLPRADKGLAVYHLGHSLVGRDMPAMLEQLALAAGYAGHSHASQLGWGASLMNHWTGEVPGFAEENAHPRHRAARAALASGDYGAVVLTEMVEIRDAIRYHDSARHLANWAGLAAAGRMGAGRMGARIYLYETWHRLDDPAGWLERLAHDRGVYWEGALLRHAMQRDGVGTIHVVPGGQVLAAVVQSIEAGQVPGLARREDLFARAADGSLDSIHLNDLGSYVIALTHFAVLYGQSPRGLPHALRRADGTAAMALPEEGVRKVQDIVWDVVSRDPMTGVER